MNNARSMQTHPPTFIDLVNRYVDSHFAMNSFSQDTRVNYNGYVKVIVKFFEEVNDICIPPEYVSLSLMEDLFLYARKYGDITYASRLVEICKRAFKWAKKRGFVTNNPLDEWEPKREKTKEVVHIEKNELEKLIDLQTNNARIERVRDVYVFQALSGLSYGDLKRYKIIKDEHGEWLWCGRKKGGNEFWVPFKGILKEIHNKYHGNLPVRSVSCYNEALREMAKGLNIHKHLTTHTARKTFATLMYEKGYSIEVIADMMGHKTPKTTQQHYLKKSRKRLEMEFKMLETA